MGAAPQQPRRLGRAVSLALAASLAVFAFSPGAVLAAGTLTVTQAAGTNCAINHFEWTFSVSGLAAGESGGVEATFADDYYFQAFPTSAGLTSDTHAFGGSSTGTLAWTFYTSTFEVISTGTATPNCAPPPPAKPTSKSQCDGAGWSSFPGFKNRGQCVSFVANGK
jgi:hypothetical protein